VNEGADQCGYCGPSLVLTTYAMKKELKDPTIEKIKHYLAGNLCRCSGFEGQLRGIKRYMGVK
jgi:carbon-monoxide dehydrogenase small subunit